MEYPFKDLLPLDEVLEREGYYKDWTHLDPEVFYSLTQISEYIKTKGYGVDVRLLIAQLAEHFGLKTTQVVDLANLLQQNFTNLEGVTQSFTNNINSLVAQMEADKNAVIANVTVDSEVILSRGNFTTLGERLDEADVELSRKSQEYYLDITQPPYNITPESSARETTEGINAAILDASEGHGVVYVPFRLEPYAIDPILSVQFKSNLSLKVDDGVVFEAKPVSQGSYRVFNLSNVHNVNVSGRFKIIGEREQHTGTTGEWGMGAEMRGSSNIYFEYIEANDCWGDGVYIGSTPEQNYCENIKIGELYADNNRRQGISVVSVKGLKIGYGLLTNTNGTAPEAGIDFEPNNATEFLQGVDVTLETSGNAQHGVFFFFGNYIGSQNYVDANVKLLHSHGDYYGVSFSGGGNISGEINFEKCFIEESGHYGISHRNWSSTNPDITIHKPTILNPLELQSTTSDLYASAIIVNRMTGDSDDNFEGSHIGNIKFIEPQVIETRSEPKVATPIYLNNNLNSGMVEKIEIVDPIRLDGLARKILNLSRDIKISDKHEVLKVDIDQSVASAGATNYATKYTTKGVEFDVTVNLANSLPIGVEQEFVVDSDYKLTIHTTNRIYPIEPSFGKNISATGKGCRIKIKKVSSNQWEVLSMVGVWTVNDV